MRKLFICTVLLILVCETKQQKDSGCDAGYECVPSSDCTIYLLEEKKLNSLQTTSNEYRKLLSQLQSLICNKRLTKICCKIGNPSTTTYKPKVISRQFEVIDVDSPSWVPKPGGEGKCGTAGANAENIVGGKDADLGEYPWMALLGTEKNGIKYFQCGGTLINKWYVLSAAHCAKKDFIRLGEWNIVNYDVYNKNTCTYYNDISKRQCLAGGPKCSQRNCNEGNGKKDCTKVKAGGGLTCAPDHQDIKVEREIIHPGYQKTDNNALINDIMLLKLAKAAVLNNFVRPICLPDVDVFKLFGEPGHVNINNGMAIVAGWGKTGNRSKDWTKLQKLTVPVLSLDECMKKYSKNVNQYLSVENHICAGGEKQKDSCNGDSGGPLVVQKNDFSPNMIIGVVSFGTARCANGAPGVYTRVTSYRQWIEDNLV